MIKALYKIYEALLKIADKIGENIVAKTIQTPTTLKILNKYGYGIKLRDSDKTVVILGRDLDNSVLDDHITSVYPVFISSDEMAAFKCVTTKENHAYNYGGFQFSNASGDSRWEILHRKYEDDFPDGFAFFYGNESEWRKVLTLRHDEKVGIKTDNPQSTLDVNGSLDKNSGSFKIDHPLEPTEKFLRYGFVESPRYDLIHRGKIKLKNGKATVNIDKEYGMTEGTFEALCQNKEVTSLQAVNSFVRVKATEIQNGEFIIEAEEKTEIEVNWTVIAERADKWIKHTKETDKDGHLINEIEKEEPTGREFEDQIEPIDDDEEEGEEEIKIDMSNKKGFYRNPEAHGLSFYKKRYKKIKRSSLKSKQ
ncbi:MAG: hypothetical protein ACOC35_05255 [Promethearchaeia archaeon]